MVLLSGSLLAVLPGFSQGILQGEFGAAREPRPAAPVTYAPAKSPSVPKAAPAKPAASKRSQYPYHGTLAAAAADESQIALAGKEKQRVILITPRTNITRDGRRVKLSEAMPGERVTGSVLKNSEGREEALTVRLKSAN